jgi:hypothetical protein
MGRIEQVVSEPSRLYHRELPGGGYVTIELVRDDAAEEALVEQTLERRSDAERRAGHEPPAVEVAEGRPCRGRVAVERRAPGERREGHELPIIAEVERADVGSVFSELYQIASDNVAVARGLLSWQAARRAAEA